MLGFRFLNGWVIGMTAVGLSVSVCEVMAETRPGAAATVRTTTQPPLDNIALTPQGALIGRLVDSTGTPIEGAQVRLNQGKQEIARTITDNDGQYSFKVVKGGVYQASAGDGQVTFRAWTNSAAPPGAKTSAMIVTGKNSERGQLAALAPAKLLAAGAATSAATIGTMAVGNATSPPAISSIAGSTAHAAAGQSAAAAPAAMSNAMVSPMHLIRPVGSFPASHGGSLLGSGYGIGRPILPIHPIDPIILRPYSP